MFRRAEHHMKMFAGGQQLNKTKRNKMTVSKSPDRSQRDENYRANYMTPDQKSASLDKVYGRCRADERNKINLPSIARIVISE